MAPPKTKKDVVLDLCTKATLLGNKISVHMLEYLSTVTKHPDGFDTLAHEFLDICRILWSVEAGLIEFTKTNQMPIEMLQELEKKFKAAYVDFQALDQMLFRFLDYERRGTMGKISKGWRKMFPDNDIYKMRESLGKTREALRMSALVFQWSLGNAKIDDSVGIGYTGLAAALDRMDRGRSVAGIAKVKSLEAMRKEGQANGQQNGTQVGNGTHNGLQNGHNDHIDHSGHNSHLTHSDTRAHNGHNGTSIHSAHSNALAREDINHPPMPSLPTSVAPTLPPLPAMSLLERDSGKEFLDEDIGALRSPQLRRHPSISGNTIASSHPSHHSHEKVAGHLSPVMQHRDVHMGRDTYTSHSHDRDRVTSPVSNRSNPHMSMITAPTTETDTLAHEFENMDIRVTHIKVDPFTMPRWSPRNTAGANASNLKATLISSVQTGNHNLIEQLLDRGVPADTEGDTSVLNMAVMQHDTESIRLLLLFGANPNFASRDGATPLSTAIRVSFIEGATTLLKYGADPNLSSHNDIESPLATAIDEANIPFIQLLLTYGGDPNHMTTTGATLLIGAIGKKSSRKFIDLLLGYGADANGKSRAGETPLFKAITCGRVDIVTALLDAGANPNLPGPKHMLWPAAHEPACLEVLLARGADARKAPGVMELSTSINNMESVRMLLKAGVDPNTRKDGVWTPLCTAIRDNRAELFHLILEHGADPNHKSAEYPAWKCVTHFRPQFLPHLVAAGADLHKPKGILEMAVQMNNVEALRWLLAQGVNPNDRSSEAGGATALTTAIRENRPELVDFLLANGADANMRGQDWPVCMAVKTPSLLRKILPHLTDVRAHKGVLEMAVQADQLDSIKLLLAAGVSVEDKNGGVFSPLTTALREDRYNIVHYLLDHAGADVNAPGEHLPIVKAVRRHKRGGDFEMLEALLRKGADPNKVYRGWNAIMQAVEDGDADVLRMLVERGGGADLQAQDEAGRTVAEMVKLSGWEEGGEILLGNAR